MLKAVVGCLNLRKGIRDGLVNLKSLSVPFSSFSHLVQISSVCTVRLG